MCIRDESRTYFAREPNERHGPNREQVINEITLPRLRPEKPQHAATEQHHAGDLHDRA
jgi:hypothetical protein